MIFPITLRFLVNEQHQTFHLAVKALVEKYTAEDLGIPVQFAAYLAQIAIEQSVLEPIAKSQLTSEITVADAGRDDLGRGLRLSVDAACFHYDADKKTAARRLKVVTDHYGNIGVKMLDEETGAIISMIDELRLRHAADLTALGLNGWVDALEIQNNLVVSLLAQRGSESLNKSNLRMVDVRTQVDEAYKALTRRIEALIELNGAASHAAFVTELNSLIEHNKNIIAQRKGAAASGNSEETGEGEVNDGGEGEITPQPLP